MDRLKNALTRKIGPFAAWVWFAIAGGALYFYRRHGGSLSGVGGGQQGGPALTYYGPYGQDAYPIQGGSGTGPGSSGDPNAGAGTNNSGGNTNGGPPVINVEAPPTAAPETGMANGGGQPRTQKPQPKHKIGKKPKKPSVKKRSNTTTHTNQARTKTTAKGGGNRTASRQRTPNAFAKAPSAGGRNQAAAHPAPHAAPPRTPARSTNTWAKPHPKPATRKVTRR